MHAIEIYGLNLQALGHLLHPVRVIDAAAFFQVQQSTGNRRMKNLACLLVFDFMQAALPTSIAQRFPLPVTHLRQRFHFPERLVLQFHFGSLSS